MGVEVGGAAKNVVAIAAGAVIGAGLGENARAALVTRGLAELSRLTVALGGRQETVAGLSGLGDLLLTTTGPGSRNTALGRAWPRPELAEGRSPRRSASRRAWDGARDRRPRRGSGVELPICHAVADLLGGSRTVGGRHDAPVARPRRDE